MAFPTALNAREAYDDIRDRMRQVRALTVQERAKIAAASVTADLLISLMSGLHRQVAAMEALTSTPGLAQYARDQADNQALNIVAEYTAARTAIWAARDWLSTNLNALNNASGRPDLHEWNGFEVGFRSFTTGQTAPLLPLLDAITAAIVE